MKKVNFFIAGISKSATTSLHSYLDMHPEIFMSPLKEPQYFIKDILVFPHNGPGDRTIKDIVNSYDEYHKLFTGATDEKIIGESSSDYLYYDECAEKIKQYYSNARILFILRNPVDRAYSAYTHLRRELREVNSFEHALNMEEERIKNNYGCMWHLKAMGLYYEKVKHFIDVFGEKNIKVVLFEDFKNDSSLVLDEICDFLEVSRYDYKKMQLVNYNISGIPKSKNLLSILKLGAIRKLVKVLFPNVEFREKVKSFLYSRMLKKEGMNTNTRRELVEYFKEDVNKLGGLLNKDLTHWLK